MDFLPTEFSDFIAAHCELIWTGVVLMIIALGFNGAPLWVWTLLVFFIETISQSPQWVFMLTLVVALIFNVKGIRRVLISTPILKAAKALGLAPRISETEKTALVAGATWVDGELFSGRPNFKNILNESYPKLSSDEIAFIDGPLEELCSLIDDWKIHQNREIGNEIWTFMKKMGIFGMIIPKEYGGLGFSALAHSEVIMKLASRSIPVAITAMVPNSLGPAELLKHFGTSEQKNWFLPRLAKGEEIPCFALTEPRAGSDAGSLESEGVLFKKDGKLFIRLNWNKRWITLSGVSTILGLAFQLRDPDGLLGAKDQHLGITCALIPSNTPGVFLGRRHDPLGIPFNNCPTQGKDVEIPADSIIGGIANAGKGWGMLMECLGAGRGISLPAQAVGTSKLISRITSNYTSIRKQFGVVLAKLEGVEEPLARISSLTYAMEAMRVFTAGAIDRDIKPSVITAIAKYNSTEMARHIVESGMDIMAGAGITRGPRNLIALIHSGSPISITVEGANILTRTLIIFGQGLFRAHPWAYKEVEALETSNASQFDIAIWGHAGHTIRNVFRAVLLSISRGRLALTPGQGAMKGYFQKLAWTSASFAVLADVAMLTLGENLKKKEKLSGRFADILSWMYINASTLRRFHAEGLPKADLPFVHYALDYGLNEIQKAFDGIFANLSVPGLGWFFRYVLRSWSRLNPLTAGISDYCSHLAAVAVTSPGEARNRLTQGIYFPKASEESMNRLEHAYEVIKQSDELEKRINQAMRKGILPKDRVYRLIEPALKQGILTKEEAKLLNDAAIARWDACQVDDFSEAEYHGVDESSPKMFRPTYKGPAGPPDALT